MIEKKLSIDEIEQNTQIPKETIEKIQGLYINSEHKRLGPQKPNRE